jgi:hypothetical protein
MLMLAVLSCKDVGVPDSDWPPITDCIMGVAVDYRSHLVVRDQAGVERAFNAYIRFARANNQDIAGYGNNWRFDSASQYGLYEGVKYWAVSASWFSTHDNQWHEKNVFDVSEHGNVVRLPGCI